MSVHRGVLWLNVTFANQKRNMNIGGRVDFFLFFIPEFLFVGFD